MSLSSSSTFSEIQAAYIDNASYDEDGSAAKARAFRTACRILLLKLPKKSGQGMGSTLDLNPELILKQLDAATAWLNVNDTSSGGSVNGASYPAGGPLVSVLSLSPEGL